MSTHDVPLPDDNQSGNRKLRGNKWFWCDKKVTRFFRSTFKDTCPRHHANLNAIYLALCEMDSDFMEGTPIRGFKATLQTYSGKSAEVVTKYFHFLEKLELVNVQQYRDEKGHFGRTFLYLSEFTNQDILYNADPAYYNIILDDPDFRIGKGYQMIRYTNNDERGTCFPGHGDPGEPEKRIISKISDNNENNISNEKLTTEIQFHSEIKSLETQENKSTDFVHENIKQSIETQKIAHSQKTQSFIDRAEKLATIISSHIKIRKDAKIKTWFQVIEKMYRIDNIPLKRIDDMLDWYAVNIGGDYVPQAFTAQSFRDKFPSLEKAKERSDKKKNKPKTIYEKRKEMEKYDDTYDLYPLPIQKTMSIWADTCNPDDPYEQVSISYTKAIEMIKNNTPMSKYMVAFVWSVGIQEGLLKKEDYPYSQGEDTNV